MTSIHPTLRRLNAEWQEFAQAPVPEAWRRQGPLGPASPFAEALVLVRPDPDAVLGALLGLREAAAQRVVLQAMLGRAVLDAARDPSHDLDDYIAELWLGIATYPLDRRPTQIAANLALDARKRVRGRRAPAPVDPARLAVLADKPETGHPAALLLARARRVAVIDGQAERALLLVYADGLGCARAAAVLGVDPAVLRQRCHRALRRLAAHATDLQGVAA